MNEYETKGKDTYTQEEAFQSSLNYFNGDELAARVWVNKYALKDSYGNIFEKNPDDMHRRLAKEISRIENRYPNPLSEDTIFEVLRDFKYIVPQGGPMTGIGNEFQIASLSNCFVIGNEGPSDSYGGVMKIDQEQVQLMKRRGGVGHDLSHIRPKGSPVKNSALTSTGIVPFMERYSNSTREVAQDGRRGALMLSVSINHPDSESFIDAKMTEGKVTGANVSVKIDDEFMRAVINDEEYEQKYPVYSDEPKNRKQINARQLWNKIVHNAWKSAEPGILFWDTIIRESVPDCYADLGFRTVSTNPCGEIPLCPYDSCRLMAINLYGYVDEPWTDSAVRRYVKDAGHLYERLNRLTRADATTQNKRKAMIFSQAMDEMEERVRELKKKEDFDAIRPDLDGNEIMALLGLEPGPMIGRAYKHMLEYRLDNGPVDHDVAVEELKRWYAEIQ